MPLARGIAGRLSSVSREAVVLGPEGFVLLAVDEHDGEPELAVETSKGVVECGVAQNIAAPR